MILLLYIIEDIILATNSLQFLYFLTRSFNLAKNVFSVLSLWTKIKRYYVLLFPLVSFRYILWTDLHEEIQMISSTFIVDPLFVNIPVRAARAGRYLVTVDRMENPSQKTWEIILVGTLKE